MVGLASAAVAPSPISTSSTPATTSNIKPSSAHSPPAKRQQPANGRTPLQKTPLTIKPTAAAHRPATQPPQPADKMAMSAVVTPILPTEPPRLSMTSKEWIIPPRPKPGRKPATDTPPTKRKAQNRAAQRAFRERRAARVGELEELLDEQKAEHVQKEKEMQDRIHELELDVQSFRSRCHLLENMLERERQDRIRIEARVQSSERDLARSSDGFRHQGNDHSSRTLISGSYQPQATENVQRTVTHHLYEPTDAPITCGRCSPAGRCACADEVMASGCGKCGVEQTCKCLDEATTSFDSRHELKRPVSPSGPTSNEKRRRSGQDNAAVPEADFPHMSPSRELPSITLPLQDPVSGAHDSPLSEHPSSLRDSCGFCKEGTYCLCADSAMVTPATAPTDTLPRISMQQERTPPPSEADVALPPLAMEMTAEGAVKLPPRRTKQASVKASADEATRGCGPGGPGTCAQCVADPKSGLFCRLMAANADLGEGSGGGCCGGKGKNGGGCCKTKGAAPTKSQTDEDQQSSGKNNITLPSLPSLGLSCAEAYQTLSSHRNFAQAADDIGSWLPKLKATPRGGAQAAPPGRMMPIEVEAASIMSVLKEFDIRFGRGGV